VDEYQDVNPVQQAIFDLVAAEGRPASGPLLVAVGDRKQSIYGFRGADVAVFQDLLRRFRAAPGARVLDLATNHRSSPPVLEVVNAVFARCMQPPAGDPRPYELAFEDADRLVPARSGGAAPACEILEDAAGGTAAERRAREARAIAARIGALVSGAAGIGVPDPSPEAPSRLRRPRPGDVAVLFRRLTQLAEYERALREAGVPYRIARGGGFYQAPEVRDLGELLATLVDPGDAIAWAALLRSPFCAVSEGALLVIARDGLDRVSRQDPEAVAARLLSADPAAADEADRVRRLLRAWHELRSLRDRVAVAALLARAVERLDLEAAHLASPDGERRVANLRKAIALARRLDEGGGTAAAFAARLRRMARQPPREPEAELEPGDAVALLSIHQAKGLEWPIVFVPDVGVTPPRDGRRAALDRAGALTASFHDPDRDVHHATRSLAGARAEAARAAAAESRRLLYVALTRARDRLVISGEAGRGGESWRALLEEALAGRPELVVRVPLEEAGAFACGPAAAAGSPCPGAAAAAPAAAPEAGAPVPALPLAGLPPLLAIRVAVTEVAEHQRCPRRLAFREMGVPEHGVGGGGPQDDPDRATARGTLAHAMIAEADLAAPPPERHAQLSAAAARRGYDPRSPGVRRIVADVTRFLASPAGVDLAAASRRGALRREVPFLLRTDGEGAPSCYLSGAVDALVDGEREVAVIDFKYALASAAAVERYRFQLLAYALAVGRARPGRRVTTRLQFLRGDCRAVDLTPGDRELRELARALPRLAAALHDGSMRALEPAALGRARERCLGEGCGFVARCYR
jgi:ATP-dependent exoDNAse (exonuclease V) beta subunit